MHVQLGGHSQSLNHHGAYEHKLLHKPPWSDDYHYVQ